MDHGVYRLVVAAIGCIAGLCILCACYLEACGRQAPTALYTLAGAAIGSLIGVLAPQPKEISDHGKRQPG